MQHPNRREFLWATGTAVTVGSLWTPLAQGASRAPSAPGASPAITSIHPHRPVAVEGVHVYTDRPSYRAGETVTVAASTTVPCTLELVRLGNDLDSPAQDVLLHSTQILEAAPQAIHPGSYIQIEKSLPSQPLPALAVECWIRAWHLHEPQAVISQMNDGEGWGLLLFPDGTVGFATGETADPWQTPHRSSVRITLADPPTFNTFIMPPANWHHVVAMVGAARKWLWIDGRLAGTWEITRSLVSPPCPLRIGAAGTRGAASNFLDADIAMPVVYGKLLTEDEIKTRYVERGLVAPPADENLLGCWPLTEEGGDVVADISPHQRQGRIINHATWMIGGPSFLPAIARYRRNYVPAQDVTRGHGLRLASDDLYDCRWKPTFSYQLPADAPSGLYAVRGRYQRDGAEVMTHSVFVVRPALGSRPAPIALLFATNTWKAYSGAPFAPAWPGVFANVNNKGYQPKLGDPAAAFCFYRFHRAGQPAYQLGWRMPWPAASPYALASAPEVGYSHLSRADRFTQRWFEEQGYPFAALSDLDLHRDPQALEGVKVLYIVGHSEYWTTDAMQTVRNFLDRGGHVVCLSGNTMYWRVTHSQDDQLLECRKADAWGAQLADYMRGECWHAHDQQRGGVPRDCGNPEWQTLGVEFMAANEMNAQSDGAFHVVAAEHPLFHQPHETGLKQGDRFAFSPSQPGRQPLGHESDVLVSTLMDITRRLPKLAGLDLNLRDPAGIERLAIGQYRSDGRLGAVRDYAHRVVTAQQRQAGDSLCDVILWNRPGGGKVFAAASIAAGWTLSACPRWSALMQNVLHHFGVEQGTAGDKS